MASQKARSRDAAKAKKAGGGVDLALGVQETAILQNSKTAATDDRSIFSQVSSIVILYCTIRILNFCVLQCFAVCCSVLPCVAVWCSVVQCVAVCCSVLQFVAVCCSVFCSVLQC